MDTADDKCYNTAWYNLKKNEPDIVKPDDKYLCNMDQPTGKNAVYNQTEGLTFLAQKVNATHGLLHLETLLLLARSDIPESNGLVI